MYILCFQEQFKNVTGERINLLNTGRQVKFTSPLVVVWTVFGILSFYLYYDNLTLCISCVFGYQMLNTALILKLWVYNFLAISSTISQYEKHFKEVSKHDKKTYVLNRDMNVDQTIALCRVYIKI